jgi:hypothetical protein
MALKSITYQNHTFDISYEIVNHDKKKTMIFLHGWGSNKEIMQQAFAKKFQNFKHIYLDMPGFGKSSNNTILTTFDYASIVRLFLNAIKSDTKIIFGHSFGGKVATLLNPKTLVLLSSAGIVEEKNAKTLLTIKMAKIFNKFGLGKVTKLLRSGDVNMMPENMYATFKNVVDEEFNEEFKKYDGNAILFWGEKDTATTLNSGKIINSLIPNSKFHSYDDDHYFFLRYADNIEKTLLGYLEN